MRRVGPEKRRLVRLHAIAAAAGVAMLAGHLPSFAQQTSGIRGQVAEDNVNGDLLGGAAPKSDKDRKKQQPQAAEAPGYQPSSAGALPDEQGTSSSKRSGTLFPDAESDATAFGDTAPPEPGRRPVSAQKRAENANKRAAKPATSKNDSIDADIAARDESTTGTVRVGTIDGDVDLAVDPRAKRVEAIEALNRNAEANPYAPLGIRAGSFLLTPTLETGLTWTSNSDSSSAGSPALLSESTLRLNAVSDWSRHSAAFEGYGTFRKSVAGAPVQESEGGLNGNVQLELGNEYRARTGFNYLIKPESASSPVVIVGTATRPLRQTLTGTLGLEKDLGKLRLGVTGSVERDWYGDAQLSAGGVLSQRDRNSTLASVTLRGGYEISPAIRPFVELEYGRRLYELQIDTSGYRRSTNRVGARAGVALDLGEKVNGEISAGWIRESFDDSRLAAISGATVNANLNWSPVRGTTVGLSGATTVEGTTTAGESGSILYSGKLSLARDLRANLTGNVALGASLRDYAGSNGRDVSLSAEAGFTYWFNRFTGLTGRARHETVTSNLPGRSSKTNSVFMGIKLQR